MTMIGRIIILSKISAICHRNASSLHYNYRIGNFLRCSPKATTALFSSFSRDPDLLHRHISRYYGIKFSHFSICTCELTLSSMSVNRRRGTGEKGERRVRGMTLDQGACKQDGYLHQTVEEQTMCHTDRLLLR